MCTTKLSPTAFTGVALGRLEHARAVDGDVPLRIAQDREDRRRLSVDSALDLNPLARHGAILSAAYAGGQAAEASCRSRKLFTTR